MPIDLIAAHLAQIAGVLVAVFASSDRAKTIGLGVVALATAWYWAAPIFTR